MSRPSGPRLPKLLVLLLFAGLLFVVFWPAADKAPSHGGRSTPGLGDSDGVGDTIRTLTARIGDFQRQVEGLEKQLAASRSAREELARRIGKLEEAPPPAPAAAPGGQSNSPLDTLNSTMDQLRGLTGNVATPPPPPDMPVGFGFDPTGGASRWVGPKFTGSRSGGLR